MLARAGRWAWILLGVMPLAACASSGATTTAGQTGRADLRAARAAVAEAKRVGADKRAPDTFRQAETHLKEAESLAGRGAPVAAEKAQQAEFLGRLATAEARCATSLARLHTRAGAGASPEDTDGTGGSAGGGQRRGSRRVALLQRDLELTELEVVRTKARLQGLETKAEASSAIAEARILMGRLDARDRTTLARCQELLAKAEQQINENNFGAAVFFARKAQDIATKAPTHRPLMSGGVHSQVVGYRSKHPRTPHVARRSESGARCVITKVGVSSERATRGGRVSGRVWGGPGGRRRGPWPA